MKFHYASVEKPDTPRVEGVDGDSYKLSAPVLCWLANETYAVCRFEQNDWYDGIDWHTTEYWIDSSYNTPDVLMWAELPNDPLEEDK